MLVTSFFSQELQIELSLFAFSPGKNKFIAQCIKDPQQNRNPTHCAKFIVLHCAEGHLVCLLFLSFSSAPFILHYTSMT